MWSTNDVPLFALDFDTTNYFVRNDCLQFIGKPKGESNLVKKKTVKGNETELFSVVWKNLNIHRKFVSLMSEKWVEYVAIFVILN